MSGRIKVWSAVALITLVGLLGVPAVMAGATVGTGPDNAMAPAAGPVHLAPGQQQWYAFNSSQAPAGAGDAQIMVRLATRPRGSAAFSVWTKSGALDMLAGDTKAVPVGKGTVNVYTDRDGNKIERFNGDQVWISSSRAAEKYYVVVQSYAPASSTYTLTIAGNYVSFPTAPAPTQPAAVTSKPAQATNKPAQATSQPAQATSAPAIAMSQLAAGLRPTPLPPWLRYPAVVQPAAPAGPTPPPPPVVTPVAGPTGQAVAPASNGAANPYAIAGAAHQLGVGQQHWYTFQSPGRDAAGNQVVLSLMLAANPAGSATFSIWSNRGLALIGSGDPNGKPIGNGTLHPVTRDGVTTDRFGGNLQWSGALVDAGTYYVQVQQHGPAPSTYTLQMTQQ
jgi:hypothetical protein